MTIMVVALVVRVLAIVGAGEAAVVYLSLLQHHDKDTLAQVFII
jgi:hypothetical protein